MSETDSSEDSDKKVSGKYIAKKLAVWIGSVIMIVGIVGICVVGWMHHTNNLTHNMVGSTWSMQANIKGHPLYKEPPVLSVSNKETGYMELGTQKTKIPLEIKANKHLILGEQSANTYTDLKLKKQHYNEIDFAPVSVSENGHTQHFTKKQQQMTTYSFTKE